MERYALHAAFLCVIFGSTLQASLLDTQALFSFASYCPYNKIQDWSCYWCKHPSIPLLTVVDAIYNENADTSGYIGYYNNIVQIAYRGTITLSITDWIDDFKFAKKVLFRGMPGIEVHEGFLEVYDSLAPKMWSALQKTLRQCPQCSEVQVTGHSLGAAVATIAAVELKNRTSLPVRLTNYGSPRVGNDGFFKYVSNILPGAVRVVHANDIVPHVPLEIQEFHHIATEIWEKDGQLKVCDNSGEDPTCSDSIWVPSIPDHASYMTYDLLDGWPDCAGIIEMDPPSASIVKAPARQ
jgi:hypothetical protein